jgi:hypothetical protein
MVCQAVFCQFVKLFAESGQSENCFTIPLVIEIDHFFDLKVEKLKELSFGFGKGFEKL